MIDLLAALVSPSFGSILLAKLLEALVPAALSLLLAILTLRTVWMGLQMTAPGAGVSFVIAELGVCLLKAAVLAWVLRNWPELAADLMQESTRLTARVIGAGATPAEIASKLVALVSRFGDASMFGLLDTAASSNGQAPSNPGTSLSEMLGGLAAVFVLALIGASAALIAMMLALPQLLAVLCLAVGPLALGAWIADTQLTEELLEGWAEATAAALLSLVVMGVIAVLVSVVPMPESSMGARIGVGNRSSAEDLAALAEDLAKLLLMGNLMFMVLPIASGLVQGRPPAPWSFIALVLASCLLPLRLLGRRLMRR